MMPSSTALVISSTISSSAVTSASPSASASSVIPTTSSGISSSQISSIASKTSSQIPTSTLSSTTSILSSTTSALSSSTTSSSQTATSTALAIAVSSSSHHSVGMHVGIAFGVIAGLASLVTLVVWLIRTRSRARRQALRNTSTWPWDRDDNRIEDGCQDNRGHNPGFMFGLGFRGAWVNGMDEPKPSRWDKNTIQRPPVIIDRQEILRSTHDVPMARSPYPTIQIPNAHGSVPDLAPDLGRLQVANYVPGDLSSNESSRATSRASSVTNRSGRAMSNKSDRHWTPPRVDTGLGLAIFEEKVHELDVTELSELPLPGEVEMHQPEASNGWASSFRTNLANVMNVVVGGTTAPPVTQVTAPSPTRTERRLSTQSRKGASFLSRRNSVHSGPTTRRNSLSNAARAVPIRAPGMRIHAADPHELVDRLTQVMYDIAEGEETEDTCTGVEKPAPAFVNNRDRNDQAYRMLSRASSVYSVMSPPSDIAGEMQQQFTLPPVTSVSRTGSGTSFQQAVQLEEKALHAHNSKRQVPPRSPQRPIMLRHGTSSSGDSMGSDMSRTSSPGSEPLTDGEQYAQQVLRERRKRVTASRINNVKQSLRRPSVRLGSRRRGLSVRRKHANGDIALERVDC